MSAPWVWKQAAFAAAVEAVAGTAETINFANHGIRLIGATLPRFGYLAPNTREDAITGGIGTPPPAEPAGEFVNFAVRFCPVGAGSAYAYTSEAVKNVPECHPLLRASGLALDVATSIATYSWSDDPLTTITAALQIGGKQWTVKYGVCHDLVYTGNAGQFPVFECQVTGLVEAFAESALSAATYDSFTASPWPIIKGASSLVIGSYEPQFQSLTVTFNNTYEPNLHGNATGGHAGGRIVSVGPITAAVNARVPALSSWDPRADLIARTSRTLDHTAGGTQYQRIKIDADAAVVTGEPSIVQEGNFVNWSVEYQLAPHATAMASLVFD